ncbi:MAG: SlyX family protein [Kofleriaceae bacterium]
MSSTGSSASTEAAAELAQRVTDLEIRIAYQDRTIAELDEVVRAFTLRVEALERDLGALRATLASPDGAAGAASEPPPHY